MATWSEEGGGSYIIETRKSHQISTEVNRGMRLGEGAARDNAGRITP